MNPPRWLALVVGLQVAWLLTTAVTAQRNLVSGRVIRVETVPVDPRDLLRGDYVILSYDFSRIPLDRFLTGPAGDATPSVGAQVYVALAPQGEFFRLSHATLRRPKVPAEQILLRGHVTRVEGALQSAPAAARVEYGLERFYVREGTGQPQGKLTVDVSVADDGIGMIKEVYLDGVPYAQAMRGR